jgi:hypothetical protein
MAKKSKPQHHNRILPPETAKVDFEQNTGTSVFHTAEQNSGGYGVLVTHVKKTENEIIVYFETSDPPPYAILIGEQTLLSSKRQSQKSVCVLKLRLPDVMFMVDFDTRRKLTSMMHKRLLFRSQ